MLRIKRTMHRRDHGDERDGRDWGGWGWGWGWGDDHERHRRRSRDWGWGW